MATDAAMDSLLESAPLKVAKNLFEDIACHLSPWDMSKLANLHPALQGLSSRPALQQFLELLAVYFADGPAIRSKMREWGCIISGSSALAFIVHPDDWGPTDLDIYVPSQYGSLMATFICVTEGYEQVRVINWPNQRTAVEENQQGSYEGPGQGARARARARARAGSTHSVARVIKLSKVAPDGRELKIDVVVSRDASVVKPLVCFHSTIVMNYLGPDEAVVFYPELLAQKRSVQQHGILSFHRRWISKYTDRGYTLLRSSNELPEGESCGSACPVLPRSSQDKYCWRLGFTDTEAPDDTWGEYEWRLKLPQGTGSPACWNPACPRNEIELIATRAAAYRRDAQGMICGTPPRHHAANGNAHQTGSQGNQRQVIETFTDGLQLFQEKGMAVLKSEWALLAAYSKFVELRKLYTTDRIREAHTALGTYRRLTSLHDLVRNEEHTFLEVMARHLESKRTLQIRRDALHVDLSNFITRHYTALMSVRSSDMGFGLLDEASDGPTSSKAKIALCEATGLIRQQLIRIHDTDYATRAEIRNQLADLNRALFRATGIVMLIVDRQCILLRQLMDLQMRLHVFLDDADAQAEIRTRRGQLGAHRRGMLARQDDQQLVGLINGYHDLSKQRQTFLASARELTDSVGADDTYDDDERQATTTFHTYGMPPGAV